MRARACVLLVAAAMPFAAQAATPLPSLTETEITLRWEDFKRLVEAAAPAPTPGPAPPRDAVLRSAVSTGRIADGVLTLDVALSVEVLHDGWVRVPLWSQGAVVSFDGGGAVLSRDGGRLELIARGPRSYDLTARLVMAASNHPGENRLALELPDASRNLIDITLGPGLSDLRVDSGLAYRVEPGRAFAALVDGRAALSYSVPYRGADVAAGEELRLEPRVLLASTQFLNLGDGVIGGILVLDYQIRVAEVDHLELQLPDGIEVFDASTAGLESWKVLARDGGRVLRLRLGAPVKGALRAVVTFDGAYDPDAGILAVPRFAPVGVERESGFVAVAADGAEVELGLSGNLLPADVSEIPAEIRGYGGNLVEALKYSGEPDPATVTVIEHEDAAVLTAIVDRMSASTVLLANGTEATWLDLTVTNNRKQFLALELAAEVEVWSLLVDGAPSRPKRDHDTVMVPLPTSSSERTSQISIVLLHRGEQTPWWGAVRPSLPGLDVPVSEAAWTVYLPPGSRYRPVPGAFQLLAVTRPLLGRVPRAWSYATLAAEGLTAPGAASRYLSDEMAMKQEAQQEQIQKLATARQGASRKGSLPVRIRLPGGVTDLPRVLVTRMLIVDDERPELSIRVYPDWLRPLLTLLQVGLVLVAGVLLGLLTVARVRWARWPLPAAAAAVALLPTGGLGPVEVVIAMLTLWLVTVLAMLVARRRNRRRGEGAMERENEIAGYDQSPGQPRSGS